jgi:hypothetical protein
MASFRGYRRKGRDAHLATIPVQQAESRDHEVQVRILARRQGRIEERRPACLRGSSQFAGHAVEKDQALLARVLEAAVPVQGLGIGDDQPAAGHHRQRDDTQDPLSQTGAR